MGLEAHPETKRGMVVHKDKGPHSGQLNLPVFSKYEDYQHYKMLNAKHFSWRLETEASLVGKENQLLKPEDSIYIMEQLTPMYYYVSKKYPKTVGSEFFENRVPRDNTRMVSAMRMRQT